MAELVLPEPSETFEVTLADGAPIRIVRHGNVDGARLVVSHGNGFASDAYFPFWRLALDRFDLVLFDYRNYGRNPFHGGARHDYQQFLDDIRIIHDAINARWGEKTTIAAFHSMSAVTALAALVAGNWYWDAAVLFDPPVTPPESHELTKRMNEESDKLYAAAQIRKSRFADPSELAAVYARARQFRRWQPGVADLVARSTLRPAEDGDGWGLCCPGALEAGVYPGVRDLEIWGHAGPPARPLLIVGADPKAADAGMTALTCEAFCAAHGIAYRTIEDSGHFMQLEWPDACYAIVEDFISQHGINA